MKHIGFESIEITSSFWRDVQKTVGQTSIYNIYKRFCETGRFAALDVKGKSKDEPRPHIFWDSDIAKWIESAAYIYRKNGDERLCEIADKAIDDIVNNQLEDGYYNSFYLAEQPEKRWSERTDHELYCLGHYIEAAVAYYEATGKDKLLCAAEKYVDCVIRVFMKEKSAAFATPGHEEIELALLRLYRLTGKEKYLTLCRFFIDSRGVSPEREYNGVAHKYSQSHLPVREQLTAEGHCVRAAYLYTAMASLAAEDGDESLARACEAIFSDITEKKMYITGGIGSSARGEAFTLPYDLPNLTAYSESCAALALAWFSHSMSLLGAGSSYADTVERVLYNNALSSVSLDGKSFFYVNPLEINTYLLERNTSQENTHENLPITVRKEVFDCSCCPPNITRFFASLGNFIASVEGNALYVHQYIGCEISLPETGGKAVIETEFPLSGRVAVSLPDGMSVFLRLPYWCGEYSLTVNGEAVRAENKNGYLFLDNICGELVFDMKIEARLVYADARVFENCRKAAVMYGPVVYCAEGVNNGFSLADFSFASPDCLSVKSREGALPVIKAAGSVCELSDSLYSFECPRLKSVELTLTPYYTFANRGESDMRVYFCYDR